MLELSKNTQEKMQRIFPESLWQEAGEILENECGNNYPFGENSDEFSMERIRFAALKLSEGKIDKLIEAVILAQTDWRDLLVVAGFAEDSEAHRTWEP